MSLDLAALIGLPSDEPTFDVPCPACGAANPFTDEEWELTIRSRCDHIGDGLLRWVSIPEPTCLACEASSPASEWHRAKEAQVIAAKGFLTPRMMKAARVTA